MKSNPRRQRAFEMAHELGDQLPGFGQGQFVVWVAAWTMVDETIGNGMLKNPMVWPLWLEMHNRTFLSW